MQFEKTNRTKLNRHPDRGSFDKETIYKIIDEVFYSTFHFYRIISHLLFLQFMQEWTIILYCTEQKPAGC